MVFTGDSDGNMLTELEGEGKFTLKYTSSNSSEIGSHQTTNPRRLGQGRVCVLKSVSFRNAACNIVHISILNQYISEIYCILKNILNLFNLVFPSI